MVSDPCHAHCEQGGPCRFPRSCPTFFRRTRLPEREPLRLARRAPGAHRHGLPAPRRDHPGDPRGRRDRPGPDRADPDHPLPLRPHRRSPAHPGAFGLRGRAAPHRPALHRDAATTGRPGGATTTSRPSSSSAPAASQDGERRGRRPLPLHGPAHARALRGRPRALLRGGTAAALLRRPLGAGRPGDDRAGRGQPDALRRARLARAHRARSTSAGSTRGTAPGFDDMPAAVAAQRAAPPGLPAAPRGPRPRPAQAHRRLHPPHAPRDSRRRVFSTD